MPKVGIYARLSIDVNGTKESPKRQQEDCRAYAALHDYEVADAYVDRDLSAYSGVERPEFERLLGDLEAGVIDGVVAWKFDRLVRRPRDFERVWHIIEPRGGVLASATEPIDTASDFGPFVARLLVGMAEMESKNTSARVRRAKQQAVADGKPHHGGYRGFGHDRDGRVVKAEAKLIREAAERVLRGDSLSSIARSWDAQGARTPTGLAWQTTHLRRLLMQARLAGARETSDGEWIATGAIEPILDEAIVRQLRDVLTDPRRRTTRPRVHDALLTGLLYCGECGQRMTTSGIRHRRMYQCRNRPERPGCGRVAVSASLADAEIAGAVLDTIDQPEVLAAIGARADDPSAALSEQLQRDRAALERLAVDHYTGRLSEREFAAARPALLSQISDAEAALARNTSSRSIARLAGVDVRSEWELRDHDWQRSVVRLLVARVDCARARQPYNTWQPDRLSVTATYGAAEETGDLGDQGGVAELR